MTYSSKGYLDGLTDARNGRTAFHSQTSYSFPRQASEQSQREYNDAYYEAKAKYAEGRNLWFELDIKNPPLTSR